MPFGVIIWSAFIGKKHYLDSKIQWNPAERNTIETWLPPLTEHWFLISHTSPDNKCPNKQKKNTLSWTHFLDSTEFGKVWVSLHIRIAPQSRTAIFRVFIEILTQLYTICLYSFFQFSTITKISKSYCRQKNKFHISTLLD